MKVISFDNSFYKRNLKILELNSLNDINIYLTFAKNKSLKELKQYLLNIKPTHVKLKHALVCIVDIINRIYEQLNRLKIDNVNLKEKETLEILSKINYFKYSLIYENLIKETFLKNGFVRINSSGWIFQGNIYNDYNNTNIKVIEIVNTNIEQIFKNENFILVENSKFIILENDPKPDIWYKNNIKDNFSIIINLREVIEQRKLKEYLYKYSQIPGNLKKIFVYTTGNDIDQMKKYIQIGQKLNFDIEIIFNDKILKKEKEKLMKQYNIKFKFI